MQSKRKSYEERRQGYLYEVRFPNGFNRLSTNENFLCYQTPMGDDGFSVGYMLSAYTLVSEILAEWKLKNDDCSISPIISQMGFNGDDGVTRFVVIDVKDIPGVNLPYVTVIWVFPF